MQVLHEEATHKHPKVLAWLSRHPRWIFHFTPTAASWLNAVENFFSKMTRNASAAASSVRSSTYRALSTLTLASTMLTQNRLSGPNPQKPSSPNSTAFLCPLNASEH